MSSRSFSACSRDAKLSCMSTRISFDTPEPQEPPERAGEERAQERNRRPLWIILAVAAVALVLLQFAIFSSRQNSQPLDDASGTNPQETAAESAAQDPSAPESPVPTDGGYVDPAGEQEVPYEPAPGQFVGFEGMAMSIAGDVAAVDPVQLTDTGSLIPPADVQRLGWYSASAVPGAEGPVGTSVITGHINYQGQGTGYAARFANLELDQEFDILIDGEPRTFRVTQAPYRLPKGSDFPPEVNDMDGPNRVVLITCGGQFVGGALGYADNIITVAEPVSPVAPVAPLEEEF